MAKIRIRNMRTNQIRGAVKDARRQALYMAASHVLTESTKIAPLDEGPLTQTAGVAVDEANGKASVYYVQPYAVKLHESQTINIRRGRENKYLEKPMLSEGDQVQQIFAQTLRNVLGG